MKTTVAFLATAGGAADSANLIKSSSLGVAGIGGGVCAKHGAKIVKTPTRRKSNRFLITSSLLRSGIVVEPRRPVSGMAFYAGLAMKSRRNADRYPPAPCV